MTSDRTKHPYFGIPPARQPVPASQVSALRGKRVILSTPTGFVYDMRAVSDSRPSCDGRPVVDIATEEEYYKWMFTGSRPGTEQYAVDAVWVE